MSRSLGSSPNALDIGTSLRQISGKLPRPSDLMLDQRDEYPSEWAPINAVAGGLGEGPETARSAPNTSHRECLPDE